MLTLVALGISAVGAGRSTVAAWAIFLVAIAALGYLGRPGILHVYIPLLALLTVMPLAGIHWHRPRNAFLVVILGVELWRKRSTWWLNPDRSMWPTLKS
jgi:hypothetical protein